MDLCQSGEMDLLSVCQETTGVQYTSRSFAFFVPCTAHSTEDNNDISHEDFLQQQRRDIEIKITKEEQFKCCLLFFNIHLLIFMLLLI